MSISQRRGSTKKQKEIMMAENIYTSGQYLEKNPTWHIEESAWKVRHILPMMYRHHLVPDTVCEVGCGAGEVLRLLQERLNDASTLWGYDISPQAIEMCKEKANERLHFKLADIRREQDVFFDILLMFDVIEHLVDFFSYLRVIKLKSRYKLFNIPVEVFLLVVL